MAEVAVPAPLEKWLLKRQFLATVGMLFAVGFLLWAGRIKEETWADVSIWVFGLYMLGEAGATLATAYKR